jgi:alkanesulfonate monooxygenase SsuD/methylene tetrahydromethanopterin reductase-like flavin-dependent oxidoreductase (luciferase family)
VKLGLLLNPQVAQPGPGTVRQWAENLELAQVAERSGFASLHVPEHHGRSDDHLPQPIVACAALAARTSTIRVGTTVALAPLRHPVHLAEEINVLDVLSGGRAILGLGLGNHEPEFAMFGLRVQDQVGRMNEALEILQRAWQDDTVTFTGEHFTLDVVPVRPRPVQQPHPELWIGTGSAAGARRAARVGAGLLLDPLRTVSELMGLVQEYRDAWARPGQDPKVVLMRWACLDEDVEAIEERWWPMMRPLVATYSQEFKRFEDGASPDGGLLGLAAYQEDRLLVGGAAHVRQQIEQWAAQLGSDHVIVKLHGPGGPHGDAAATAVEAFGRQVAQPLATTTDRLAHG